MRRERVRRIKGRRLEDNGPKMWTSMEDFVRYLVEWQARNNVKLVHEESKGSEAYLMCNGLEHGDRCYIPIEMSWFAYKT